MYQKVGNRVVLGGGDSEIFGNHAFMFAWLTSIFLLMNCITKLDAFLNKHLSNENFTFIIKIASLHTSTVNKTNKHFFYALSIHNTFL